MNLITKKQVSLPKRGVKSRKGDNGKALVIGGSRDYVGALALAGMAALRSGADWVTIAAPEKAGYVINALSPDLVVKKYKGDDFCAARAKDILKLENDFDSVLIGNGIGMDSASFVKKYVKGTKKQLVIDADAIKSISLDMADNAILTPHAGELKILLQNSKIDKTLVEKIINKQSSITDRASLIQKILSDKRLRDKKIVLLLKGPVDAIISRDAIMYNKTGNAGMTKAGTGDVLAGLCVGFLAQGLSLMQSAVNAAYFNGLAGDILLKRKKGFTYLASDLVGEIRRLCG
ncbi:NAD(P)H-hydrate dehydratase [Candidatus Woesearchaeota archaeon]|nr:NAD(P)H-hydrate dehydratase [Candidatus Woesearchaeota archaeon]